MTLFRNATRNYVLISVLGSGLVLSNAKEAQAQRSGQVIGAGAAGLAVGLILGGMAAQQGQAAQRTQQPAPRARPTQTRPSQASSTRGVSTARSSTQSRSEIEKIQEALNLLGYDTGSVDGSMGRQTQRAIAKFQADRNFPQTSQLNVAEQKVLFAEVDAKRSKEAGDIKPPDTRSGDVKPEVAKADPKSDPRMELAHWETVRNSKVPGELEDYISRYPYGEFTKLAVLRLDQVKLELDASRPQAPKAPPVAVTDGSATPLPAIDDAAFPKAKQRRADAVAVIIGNSQYSNEIPKVDFGVRDAEAMKLMAMKTLGIDSQNIIFLKDATRGAMDKVFGTDKDHKGALWRLIDPDGRSDVFVFYSGHGVPSITETQENFLLPVDGDPKHVSFNGYPLSQLYDNLGKLKTKSTTVFLDACFSGQSPDSSSTSLIKNASPVFISKPTPSDPTKVNVFAAAGERQLSSWDTTAGHGIFTRYVMLGLAGEADEDRNKEVTAKELADYVGRQVRRAARRTHGREQEPKFDGNHDFVISSF